MGSFNVGRPRLKSHIKIIVPIVGLLVLIGAVALAVHNLNAPAEGSITQTPPSKAEVTDPYANPGTYNGKYVSFTYPAHYKKVPSQITGSYLEVIDFYATDQTSKQIAIGILKESLSDDSGIAFRKMHPDVYQLEPRTRSGAVIYTSTANGSERTAYLQHQDKVITISITSPPGLDLTADSETILNSLQWK